jgi:type VI secretion system protein ImpB
MDGKSGAEDVLQKLLADPALLQAVANTPRPAEEEKPAGGAQ